LRTRRSLVDGIILLRGGGRVGRLGGGGLGTRVGFGLLVLSLGGRRGRVGGRVFFVGEGFGTGGVVAFFTDDGDGGSYGYTLGAVLELGVSLVLIQIGAFKN
jgi:hypothetical protein